MRICTSPSRGTGGSGTSISSSLRSATRVSARMEMRPPSNDENIGSAVDANRRRQPAVNGQVGAGNVGSSGREQERYDAGDVVRRCKALRGDLALHRLAIFAVFR